MNFSQFSMLQKQIMFTQLAQQRLTAANMLICNMQMNYLLLNEEAELGINPNSEDLGKYFSSLTDIKPLK